MIVCPCCILTDKVFYAELVNLGLNTELKRNLYGYGVGIRGLGDKIQKNMN